MTPDQYVLAVLKKYRVSTGPTSAAEQAVNAIAPNIRGWAGRWLSNLSYSGSYAKGTPIRGKTDIDLFISLRSDSPGTLAEIYNSLFALASKYGWQPRRQDVSIGIQYSGVPIDLVPGRKQSGYQYYHSLYRNRTGTWMQTNVSLHIRTVRNSKRTREIRAIKIWRNLRALDFPSFYLELTVINALRYRRTDTLARNVLEALGYIASTFPSARVVDPANSNNIASDDLSANQLIADPESNGTVPPNHLTA